MSTPSPDLSLPSRSASPLSTPVEVQYNMPSDGQTPPAGPGKTGVTPPDPARSRRPKGRSKRIGIRQVAELADVSVATVSMVINQNPKITRATRQRVLRVMEEVGYTPNRLAQSLSGQYTRMLAVLLPTLRHSVADPYFGELLSGICDRAAKRGHKVLLEHTKPEFIKQQGHLELFDRRFVDGVFCVGFNERHGFLRDIAAAGRPILAVNNVFPEWGLNHVVCDYAGGAEQAVTYLQQLGHRRIGLIHGAMEAHTARLIRDKFCRMQEPYFDGEACSSYMVDGRFTEEFGAQACLELLERHPGITAVFAGNDKMALGAVHAMTRKGIRVPEDVSVLGFDDIQYSAYTTPSLSTVHTPLYDLGVLAAERLIEMVRGKQDRVADVLPTRLVLRESTSIASDIRTA